MGWIKVCGVCSVKDARVCTDAGVDAVGLNFWPASPRCCGEDVAQLILKAVGSNVLTVGVFVDAPEDAIRQARARLGFDWAQLHGDESPEVLAALLPTAYKGVRLCDAASLHSARQYGGDRLLVDAFVPGVKGGTGTTADWRLAVELARERRVVLAGGLTPDNVAEAIRKARPWGVDVASGVERAPGVKDAAKVRAFVAAAHEAFRAIESTAPRPR